MLASLRPVFVLFVTALPSPAQAGTPDCTGRWTGTVEAPGSAPVACELLLRAGPEGIVVGGLRSELVTTPVRGSFDATASALDLELELVRGRAGRLRLRLDDERMRGEAAQRRIDVRRVDRGATEIPARWIAIDPPSDPPRTVDRDGLDARHAAEVDRRLRSAMRSQHLIGVSVGHVVEGALVDVRSHGFEDLRAGIPASGRTRYRWASISKPLTAVACMQLVERGDLDLDRDVRGYVPEFPDKGRTITARQLLGHLGGITHYGPNVVRTQREYDVEHPFADRLLALDMFKETPLVADPGTRYRYSTHGYVLLGAVMERAGKKRYADQVLERIAAPLGMKTLAPDHAWSDIPHRTPGYVVTSRGRVYPSPDTDAVSWKLPGGGWISSVEDLGQFAAAVATRRLLRAETWQAVATRQRTTGGKTTPYGLGFRIARVAGADVLAHSGGQERTSTYLVADSTRRAAVVIMCNTQHASLGSLAHGLLELLIEDSRRGK